MKYYIIFLVTFLISCSNHNLDAEKTVISQLGLQYDSLLAVSKAIDIQSAKINLKKYETSVEEAKKKLNKTSTPNYKTMNFMNDLKLMKRQFKSASTKKKGLIDIIKENKKQLLNLNNDIDNSVFSKDDLKSILTQEKLLLEQTTKQVTDFQESYMHSEHRFDSLYQLSKTYQYNQP